MQRTFLTISSVWLDKWIRQTCLDVPLKDDVQMAQNYSIFQILTDQIVSDLND